MCRYSTRTRVLSLLNCCRFARKSIHLTAFAMTLVDSPDDEQHSTTRWTYLSRCYFSYPWIPHVQSLYSLLKGLKNDRYASGESTRVWANCCRADRPSGETTWYRLSSIPPSPQIQDRLSSNEIISTSSTLKKKNTILQNDINCHVQSGNIDWNLTSDGR